MADREIKTSLILEGEAKYRQQVKDAQRQLRVMRAEMKAETAAFDNNGSAIDKNAAKNKSLQKQVAKQREVVTALEKAVKASAKAHGEDSKQTDGYRIQLANAKTELERLSQAQKQAEKDSHSLAIAVQDAADKIGPGMKKAADAGLAGVKNFATTATALIASVAAAGAGAAKALWDLEVSRAGMADDLLTQAAITGIDTQTLQMWGYAQDRSDVSAETMVGAIKKLRMNMDSSSEDVKNAFLEVGVALRDENGEYREAQDVFWDIIDAMTDENNHVSHMGPTDRENLLQALFGKGYDDLMPLINMGSAGYNAIAADAFAHGMVVPKETLESFGQLADTLSDIKANMAGAGNAAATLFLPETNAIAEGIEDVTRAFQSWLNGDLSTDEVVASVEKLFGETIPDAVESGVGKVSELIDKLKESDNGAVRGIGNVLDGIIDVFEWLADPDHINDVVSGIEMIFGAFAGLKITQAATTVAQFGAAVGKLLSGGAAGAAGAATGAGTAMTTGALLGLSGAAGAASIFAGLAEEAAAQSVLESTGDWNFYNEVKAPGSVGSMEVAKFVAGLFGWTPNPADINSARRSEMMNVLGLGTPMTYMDQSPGIWTDEARRAAGIYGMEQTRDSWSALVGLVGENGANAFRDLLNQNLPGIMDGSYNFNDLFAELEDMNATIDDESIQSMARTVAEKTAQAVSRVTLRMDGAVVSQLISQRIAGDFDIGGGVMP